MACAVCDDNRPQDLPASEVTIVHSTETQLLKYHLTPKAHPLKEQAIVIVKGEARRQSYERCGMMQHSHIFKPWTFAKWKAFCDKTD